MITSRYRECTPSPEIFDDAYHVVWESGVAELITDTYNASSGIGGRKPDGIPYTVKAVLVALLIRTLMRRPPSLRGVMDTIGEFTPEQLAAVGMDGHSCAAIWQDSAREYHRFHAWWRRRLEPFDAWADIPARRMTNATYRELLAKRTDSQREHFEKADQLLHVAINRLVAASIREKAPENCRGDLVVDGTLYKVAKDDGMVGSGDDQLHGAVAFANYHVRDKRNKASDSAPATRQISYAGRNHRSDSTYQDR